MKLNPMTIRNNPTPSTQLISRGYLYAPTANTRMTCATMSTTMALAPQ